MKIRLFYVVLINIFIIMALNSCKTNITEKPSVTVDSPKATAIHTQSPSNTPILATQTPKASEKPLATKMPMTKSHNDVPTIATKKVSTSTLSNVRYGFGMKKVKGKAPEVGSKYLSLFKNYNTFYIGDTSSKDIFLTFDEGYENGYTPKILDTLKENNVKACFFITMPYLKENFELVKRMVKEGHQVGNHTVNHPSMPEVTDDKKLEEELLGLDREFFERTGENMKFLRPPKGEFSERTLAISNQLGYKTIFWSLAYLDWEVNNQKGTQYAVNSVMDYIHGGAIVLLHAVSKDNANAMDTIIKSAKEQGYTFKSLMELKTN